MDSGIDAVLQRLIRSLLSNIDNTCIASLNNADKFPDLVGVPLEILDVENKKMIVVDNSKSASKRFDAELDEAELFYSESVIRKAFYDAVSLFLNTRLANEYAGLSDPDFNTDPYEDF